MIIGRTGCGRVGASERNEGPPPFEVFYSCELFSLWFTQLEMRKGEGVCVYSCVCMWGRSQTLGVSRQSQEPESLATAAQAGMHHLQRKKQLFKIIFHLFTQPLLLPVTSSSFSVDPLGSRVWLSVIAVQSLFTCFFFYQKLSNFTRIFFYMLVFRC